MDNLSWDAALLAVKSSSIAYWNGVEAKPEFFKMGFTTHKFLNKDGAQAHLCSNKDFALISCRGTEPKELNDLLADLNTIPKRHGPGFVHSGFRGEARKIWEDILTFARRRKDMPIIVCGHSLGAAMATYIAQELKWAGIDNVTLYTFGSPRLGNDDYVDAMSVPHWRFVNNNDVVCKVPPSIIGFRHHGELKYINYYGNIRKVTRWQRIKDQLRGRWRALCKFQLFDGAFDHSMDLYLNKTEKAEKQK